MALQITITDAGRAEVINAANNGIAPVLISAVGLGTGKYIPDPAQTALQAETKQLSTIAGQATSADTIHVTIKDETADVYDVSEIGLYTDSGTLFAVYSDPTNSFMQKTAQSALMLSVDIVLGTLDATNLTFGDTSFSNPPASEIVKGVAFIASLSEALAGTDDTKIMTALKVKAVVDALVAAAPGALDTLNELAAALGDDPNFATTMTNALALKASIAHVDQYRQSTIVDFPDANPLDLTSDPSQEYGIVHITDTGAFLAGSQNVLFSNTERSFIVYNDTTQDLTIKTSAGTGILVHAGMWDILHCDGTNIDYDPSSPIGVNQVLSNVGGNRAFGVTYTNPRNKSMVVEMNGVSSGLSGNIELQLYINGAFIKSVGWLANSGNNYPAHSFIVPPQGTYKILNASAVTTNVGSWFEMS